MNRREKTMIGSLVGVWVFSGVILMITKGATSMYSNPEMKMLVGAAAITLFVGLMGMNQLIEVFNLCMAVAILIGIGTAFEDRSFTAGLVVTANAGFGVVISVILVAVLKNSLKLLFRRKQVVK